jgi:hypothetical protein
MSSGKRAPPCFRDALGNPTHNWHGNRVAKHLIARAFAHLDALAFVVYAPSGPIVGEPLKTLTLNWSEPPSTVLCQDEVLSIRVVALIVS